MKQYRISEAVIELQDVITRGSLYYLIRRGKIKAKKKFGLLYLNESQIKKLKRAFVEEKSTWKFSF